MRNKVTIEGKSMIFNIASIIVNLLGFYFILTEFLSPEPSPLMNTVGYGLFIMGLVGLIFLKGTFLMSYVARSLVGGLFIVSGMIKANDPLGFAYKLEDYFHPNALGWEFFEPYALELAIIICIAEILLGFAVILGAKIKLASFALLAMTGFFLWLTYYTADCNDMQALAIESGDEFNRECVNDCGCFGDAFKGSFGRPLAPWESFVKDAALLYLVLFIFIHQWQIKLNSSTENLLLGFSSMIVVLFFSWVFSWYFPFFFALVGLIGALSIHKIIPFIKEKTKPWWMALFVLVITGLFTAYTTMYLPLRDYRAYHVGANLIEKMNDGIPGVYEQVFIYENTETGETKRFNNDEFTASKIWENKKWEFKNRIQRELEPTIPTSIVDFAPKLPYDKMPNDMKKHPVIDSIYKANYENYYQEVMALKNLQQGYNDTILAMDYDAEIYPDSLWEKTDPFIQKIDPNTEMTIELTQYIIEVDQMILIVMKKVETASKSAMDDIKLLRDAIRENEAGIQFLVLTSSGQKAINDFEKEVELDIPYAIMDDREVKILVRSNPGMLYIDNAEVKAKFPHRSIPDWDYFKRKLLN